MKAINIRSVMIVDDHPLYSDALKSTIEGLSNARRIEVAASLYEAERFLSQRFHPSIVFFDLNLPDVTGMSGFMSLMQRLPDTPIVVISATTKPEIIEMVRSSGATGYIPKNLSRDALAEAIERTLAGERYFPKGFDHSAGQIQKPINTNNLEDVSTKLSQLTRQQTRILDMICEGKLNKQIAYELNLAEATVKTHITAMLRKLGVYNRTQAALLVRDAKMASDLE